ncbi:MAG: hypothetical protein OHK0041_00570 [Anaerolineales bacterium]
MDSLSHPHWQALTPATLDAFHLVSRLEFINRFYLAGGTGLAIHFGHRFSVDLDFFSAESDAVGFDQRSALRALLDDPLLEIIHDKDATFAVIWRGVGISFFRLNMYPLVKPPLLLEGVPLASVEEIGAMKLAAVLVNVVASLVLLPVAVFLFKDRISWVNAAGIVVCCIGLIMLNWKR